MSRTSEPSQSVLIIDDDELLCQLFVRMLDPDLCRATAVPDAELGLRIIEEGDPPLGLVLTDLQMPGLDGWDVVEVLTQYYPELPVAVMTGAADTPTATALAQSGIRVLPKPLTYRQLRRLVAPTLLESRAHARHHQPRCAPGDLVAAAWRLHRQRHA